MLGASDNTEVRAASAAASAFSGPLLCLRAADGDPVSVRFPSGASLVAKPRPCEASAGAQALGAAPVRAAARPGVGGTR